MITLVFFFILILFAVTGSVSGQSQIGFISIDCGSPDHLSYDDPDTGIKYTSDNSYIDTGVSRNISIQYQYPNNPVLPLPLSDLKSFPNGNRNCYALMSSRGKGSLNLIRASFLYGNYDDQNKLPEFDLYIDVSFWSTVRFRNASDVFVTEVISVSQSDTVYVCLVNKGLGIPFISALELRPLPSSMYNLELGTKGLLVLFDRFDIGYTNGSGRYRDDMYDRIWKPYGSHTYWETFKTSIDVNVNDDGYRAPQEVIRSYVKPRNQNDSLEFYWKEMEVGSRFYVCMYFAELEDLKNQSRKFNVSWNGLHLFGPISPQFLHATTESSLTGLVAKEHRISIYKTGNSNLPPILNAIEVFVLKLVQGLPSYDQDFAAITSILATYQLTKNWMGDPCGPRNYVWEGLECSYNDADQPRIISLNLSSNSLTGVISSSIADLTSIQILDLSSNSLSGSIPEFLGELQSLKILNLKNNKFSGHVPNSVLRKSRNGLKLIVDDHNACHTGGSCEKKNITIPIIASVISAFALAVIVIIGLWTYRRRKSGKDVDYGKDSIGTGKRKFSYNEIIHITNNFETVLGKGGFGSVYLGCMEDNEATQVAVKILSSSSSQGSKEFRAEAEILLRVHHRNLASFVGYCDENDHMALIYEYMSNGNLKDFLSDSNKACKLSWEMRIRIAIDAAQGLEYLHHGCKPRIIHRDVKSANILLSEAMDAKIADFGLSRAITQREELSDHAKVKVIGTRGYLDPEYSKKQKLTDKSDVFSFGVVLLELITGKHAIIRPNPKERVHVIEWVKTVLAEGDINGIVDERLGGGYNVDSVWKALEVGIMCTRSSGIQRESMSFVVNELKECLAMEMIPHHNRSPSSLQSPVTLVSSSYYLSTSSTEVFSGDDAVSGILAR